MQEMRIAILGFAREGKALLAFLHSAKNLKRLKKQISADDAEIWVLDKKTQKTPRGIKTKFGKKYLKNLNDFDLVLRSPGVPYTLPELAQARRQGVKFSSATKLFFQLCPCKIIGVTGTKGKGTVATLIYKILKKCGKDVWLVGNIGRPAISVLPKLNKKSIVVAELSSFQLQDLEQSPQLAVVLDIFPDHLDVHKTFREYINAKKNITKYQNPGDKVFYFPDNKYSSQVAQCGWGKKIPVNVFFKNPIPTHLPGKHNQKNIRMALAVTESLGCSRKKALEVIKKFKGMPHRLEFVRRITYKDHSDVSKNKRIKFYNDSASTNPYTAAAAVSAFALNTERSPIILIAGGKDKNLDYAPLAREIKKNQNLKAVVLFGENKNKVARALAGIKNKELIIKKVQTLKSAVQHSYKIASSAINGASVIVLFSPGAASFDMFKDYADRGQRFKKIVQSL